VRVYSIHTVYEYIIYILPFFPMQINVDIINSKINYSIIKIIWHIIGGS